MGIEPGGITHNFKAEIFMGRFSDIMRADELKADKDAYDLWLRKTRAEKRTAYQATIAKTGNKKSNVGTELGYIFPFGVVQTAKVVLAVGIVKDGEDLATSEETEGALITKLRTAVVGDALYASVSAPTAGLIVFDTRGKKIKPAKVKLVQVGAKVEGVVSRITGRPYSYRKKNSVSCSFGQKIGTATDFESAKSVIRKALETSDGDYTAYFTPQGDIDIGVVATAP